MAAVEIGFRAAFSPEQIVNYIDAAEPVEAIRWTDHPFLPFIGKAEGAYETDVPPGTHIRVRNNAYGFRSHELPTEKTASDYFVVTLGESTTWGAAATSNETT